MQSKNPDRYLQEVFEILNKHAEGRPIILHSDIGHVASRLSLNDSNRTALLEHILQAINDHCLSSSIFIPTFDYHYCQTLRYEVSNGETQLGSFSRFCAQKYPQHRTLVPVFNHVDIKGKHQQVNSLYSLNYAFGDSSFYDWFTHEDGFVFFWGCSLEDSNTYIHHVEAAAHVPYRFNKIFKGKVLVDNSEIDVEFNYLVRPTDVDVIYPDQGMSILVESGKLLGDIEKRLLGYSSKEFLGQSLRCLELDEYALLSASSRRAISKCFSDHCSLRDLSEKKRKVIVISDTTLELAVRGWRTPKYDVTCVYASSLILELQVFERNVNADQDVLLLFPTLDSFSLGLLDSLFDDLESLENSICRTFYELLSILKRLRIAKPSLQIIYISPFDSSLVPSLSFSVQAQCIISEIFAKHQTMALRELDDIGVTFETLLPIDKSSKHLSLSRLNYLRYRFPYSIQSTEYLRDSLVSMLNRCFSKANPIKAISVDLDNTLWCGIAGDGTAVVSKDYPSNSNLLLQKALKQLRASGVFLTITSRNDLDTVKDTFEAFRDKMFISLEDFTSIEVNWGLKSASIKRHAKFLNIDLDSFLHIDDSDLEIAEIMSSLPMVETIHYAHQDIDLVLNSLISHPRLHKSVLNTSDMARVVNYQPSSLGVAQIPVIQGNDFSYLSTLEISVSIARIGTPGFDLHRVRQLFGKTHQFNMCQMSYNDLANDATTTFFSLQYSDRSSTEECCSALCAQVDSLENEVTITSFVLSCRFFARGLEFYFLDRVCTELGAKKLRINFRKSKKNSPCVEFLEKIVTSEDLASIISLDVDRALMVRVDLNLLAAVAFQFQREYAAY